MHFSLRVNPMTLHSKQKQCKQFLPSLASERWDVKWGKCGKNGEKQSGWQEEADSFRPDKQLNRTGLPLLNWQIIKIVSKPKKIHKSVLENKPTEYGTKIVSKT